MIQFRLDNQKTIHFILGLVTGLSFLSINFLISFFARFDQFNFSGLLICLVIPLSILFFSIGQKLKTQLPETIFKIFIIISLLAFPFYYLFTYYFLSHQFLRNILIFLTSSLLFSGLGGLNQNLDSIKSFQINNFLNLGKLFGIVTSIFLVPFFGYIYLFYISLFIFLLFFFKFKKTILFIFLLLVYLVKILGPDYIDLVSFNKFSEARREQSLSNSPSAITLNTEKPQFFWNLRGLYTLIVDQNHIENWAHNFVLEFKQKYTNLTLNTRQLIYERFGIESRILILGAGGGASLYYFKNLNKNITLVDRDCTALDIFKKTNDLLNKVEIYCLDASRIQSEFLNKKFDLISLESSVSQSLKTQLPFLSPFNLLTLETLYSYKNMLTENGIFMFEMNLVNIPQRKIIFEAALFNLNKVYDSQCTTLNEEYSKKQYIGYILCSQNKNFLDTFFKSIYTFDKKNNLLNYRETNLNLNNNTPFLHANIFLINFFGTEYPALFFILIFIILALLIRATLLKNQNSMTSYLRFAEGASTVQFYSLIYLVGSFFKNEIYSYILVSAISYAVYYFVIKNFEQVNKKNILSKIFIYTYAILVILLLYTSQNYNIDSNLKIFFIPLILIILFSFNANIFNTTVKLSLSKQKNSNITINNTYVAGVLIALISIFLTGITFTFVLSSIVMFTIGIALYRRANNQ